MKIPFVYGELFLAGLWVAVRLALWGVRGRIDWRREALLLLMYVNLAVILRVTFFPMRRVDGRVQPLLFDASAILPLHVKLVPFVRMFHFHSKREMLVNVLGNIALFLPSGIVLPVLYKRLDSFWKVVAAGALMSLAIELMQLPFAVRTTDTDDLILNTLGVALGYGIYACVKRRRQTEGR